MKKYFTAVFITLCIIISSEAFAQLEINPVPTDSLSNSSEITTYDSTYQDTDLPSEKETYKFNDYDDFSFPYFFNAHEHPIIEFSYGISKINSKALSSSFAKTGTAEVKLGYSKNYSMNSGIYKIKKSFISFGSILQDLNSKTNMENGFTPEIWRGGFGQLYGFGYKTGGTSLSFYSSNSINWSHLNTGKTIVLASAEDYDLLDHYNNTVRFGTSTEGGAVLQFGSNLSINAGYERSIIFPAYIFWLHAGSMLIEYGGLAFLDHYVKDIYYSSPYAAPIIDFVLKNAFSYALYSLRGEKMNWPFNGASPLAVNTFKFGITFTL